MVEDEPLVRIAAADALVESRSRTVFSRCSEIVRFSVSAGFSTKLFATAALSAEACRIWPSRPLPFATWLRPEDSSVHESASGEPSSLLPRSGSSLGSRGPADSASRNSASSSSLPRTSRKQVPEPVGMVRTVDVRTCAVCPAAFSGCSFVSTS